MNFALRLYLLVVTFFKVIISALFNLFLNTFLQHIKYEKYRQCGFSLRFMNPIPWFQFPDKAAVISGQESENQHLINHFIIWCQCSSTVIRFDKCTTFGIRKPRTKSVQRLLELLVNGVLVPCVEIGESFRYLGCYFDFNMSNSQHMSELSSLVQHLMSDIDEKPATTSQKQTFAVSKLSKLFWHLPVADISKTWIIEDLRFYSKWLYSKIA